MSGFLPSSTHKRIGTLTACLCALSLTSVQAVQPVFAQASTSPPVAVQAEPTAANAPRSIDDLNCPPTRLTIPKQMLIPQQNMPLPKFDDTMFAAMRRGLIVDPAQVCRYRDENRNLGASSATRVIFLGDSITEAWKVASPDLFKGQVLDRGISGQTTTQMLLRFREDVLDLHPAVLHIMAGVNDINTPAGSVLTKSNIQSMVELAKSHGITVVLGSITPSSRFWIAPDVRPGPQIVAINDWIRSYATQNGVIYVDYWTPLQDGTLGIRGDLSNEGLHPNQAGYDIMTPLANRAITDALRVRRSKHH